PITIVHDIHPERAFAPDHASNAYVSIFIEPEGRLGCVRLVYDPEHVEAGDLAGILAVLPLAVIEIGRHGHDRFSDLFAQVVLRRLLHLLQDHRRDFGWAVSLATDLDVGVAVARLDDLVR